MSSGNLASFATLKECNLTGNSLFQVFFGFFNTGLDSTNQQNLKKFLDIKVKKCATWHRMAYIHTHVKVNEKNSNSLRSFLKRYFKNFNR